MNSLLTGPPLDKTHEINDAVDNAYVLTVDGPYITLDMRKVDRVVELRFSALPYLERQRCKNSFQV